MFLVCCCCNSCLLGFLPADSCGHVIVQHCVPYAPVAFAETAVVAVFLCRVHEYHFLTVLITRNVMVKCVGHHSVGWEPGGGG